MPWPSGGGMAGLLQLGLEAARRNEREVIGARCFSCLRIMGKTDNCEILRCEGEIYLGLGDLAPTRLSRATWSVAGPHKLSHPPPKP